MHPPLHRPTDLIAFHRRILAFSCAIDLVSIRAQSSFRRDIFQSPGRRDSDRARSLKTSGAKLEKFAFGFDTSSNAFYGCPWSAKYASHAFALDDLLSAYPVRCLRLVLPETRCADWAMCFLAGACAA
jgi:hypothetical protein